MYIISDFINKYMNLYEFIKSKDCQITQNIYTIENLFYKCHLQVTVRYSLLKGTYASKNILLY